jgi:hypothetical protein
MPMLFSPTIGAAVTAGYWFLWVRCPACRTTNAIDLRTLDDRHRDAAVTSLIPALSCRSCRPNAPFAELVRLSRTSIADEMGGARVCPALPRGGDASGCHGVELVYGRDQALLAILKGGERKVADIPRRCCRDRVASTASVPCWQ